MKPIALKKTPLYETHQKLKARLVEFSGWHMPLLYSSIIEEHRAVREKTGIFDVSHMGIFECEGPEVLEALNTLIANDLNKIKPGYALYSPLLYENGTFVDDIIVYLLSKERARLVVNAGNVEKDYAWIESHFTKKNYQVKLKRLSELCLLAVQGKTAWSVLEQLLPEQKSATAPSFSLSFCRYRGEEVMLAKTGYTGEAGVEVFISRHSAAPFFEAAIQAGAVPCGLGARDSLRLEKGYSLYGNEISEETNALEAGLGWATNLAKPDFVGKAALLQVKQQGLKRRLRGFILEGRMVARSQCRVFDEGGGQEIGLVTSGTASPSLNRSLGLAYIAAEYRLKTVLIEVRGKKIPARLTKRVFL